MGFHHDLNCVCKCLFPVVAAIDGASNDNRVAFGTFVDKPTETFVGRLDVSLRLVLNGICASVAASHSKKHSLPP